MYMTPSVARLTLEPTTLQTARVLDPRALASSSAPSVSAVSPDWEMAMVRVAPSTTGARYRNSEPMSTSTGTRQRDSTMCLPISAACHEVPQPTMTMRSIRVRASRVRPGPSWAHPRSVSSSSSWSARAVASIVRGCSLISFSMKWAYPFFSAAAASQGIVVIVRRTARPSRVTSRTPSPDSTAISPSSSTSTSRAYLRTAQMSEAMNRPSSPAATTRGAAPFRTASNCPGALSLMIPRA